MPEEIYHVATATEIDIERIVELLKANRHDPSMFVRSIKDVSKNIGDFIVARDSDGQMVGCAALHRYTSSEAEILSVAILPKRQGRGIGNMLTEKCIEMAKKQNVDHLWLATVKPAYFSRFGFVPFVRWKLPMAVLLSKLRQVLHQPMARWGPAILGQFTFMEYRKAEPVA